MPKIYGREEGDKKRQSITHRGRGTYLLLLLVGSKCPWIYNILDARASSRGHRSFILPPKHFTWTHLNLACHLHNAGDHTSSLHATHAIYTAFQPRKQASCLLKVQSTFPIIYVTSALILLLHRRVKGIFKSICNKKCLHTETVRTFPMYFHVCPF